MNYSADAHSVRVDFFKTRLHLVTGVPHPGLGQWVATEAVRWPLSGFEDCLVQDAFAAALVRHLRVENDDEVSLAVAARWEGAVAVCLQPYYRFNVHPVPISMVVKEAFEMVNSRPGILRRLA